MRYRLPRPSASRTSGSDDIGELTLDAPEVFDATQEQNEDDGERHELEVRDSRRLVTEQRPPKSLHNPGNRIEADPRAPGDREHEPRVRDRGGEEPGLGEERGRVLH